MLYAFTNESASRNIAKNSNSELKNFVDAGINYLLKEYGSKEGVVSIDKVLGLSEASYGL